MDKFWLITFLIALTPVFSFAQLTDFEAHTYKDAEGRELKYRMLKPVNYDSSKSYPLVLFLHGAGERGQDNFSQLKWGVSHFAEPKFRAKYPAFVVAPQVPRGKTWGGLPSELTSSHSLSMSTNPTQPMQLTLNLLKVLQREYSIDVSRIYITGISMGGFGTFDLIQRYPSKFAAAVPICGGGDVSKAFLLKDVPLWVFHGAKDQAVAPEFSRSMVQAIQIAGGSPGFTEYPDQGHVGAWVEAYSNPHLYEWMFSKQLDKDKTDLNKLGD